MSVDEKLVKPTDGVVSKYLNRRISLRITRFIINRGFDISPSHISIISFIIGLSASLLYLYGYIFFGGLLLQLSSIVDGVDGELARALGRVSKIGGFMDSVMDRIVNILAISNITIYLFGSGYSGVYTIYIGLFALSGDLLVTYLHSIAVKDFGVHPALIGVIPPFASRDVRIFILFISSILYPLIDISLYYSLLLLGIISYTYTSLKVVEIIINFRDV